MNVCVHVCVHMHAGVDEFVKFFGVGSLIEAQEPVPPPPPPDDLQFQVRAALLLSNVMRCTTVLP
jgi:hypothetical protein